MRERKHFVGDCRDCIFWKRPEPGWGDGQCRKRSPGWQDLGDGHASTRWPRTMADDWCGDFDRVEIKRSAA